MGTARVAAIDHVALAARDLSETVDFYGRVLGLVPRDEPYMVDGKVAVQRVGNADVMLSIHQAGGGAVPVAARPVPGSLDICFAWAGDIQSACDHLSLLAIGLVEGPVIRRYRDGAESRSVYFHDPDGNLIELMARAAPNP